VRRSRDSFPSRAAARALCSTAAKAPVRIPTTGPTLSTEEQGFVPEPRSGESPLQHRCKGTGENPYYRSDTFNGGAGIRTLVGVSTQRLSRAPPLATRPLLHGARTRTFLSPTVQTKSAKPTVPTPAFFTDSSIGPPGFEPGLS
jgi:hypothetical protein